MRRIPTLIACLTIPVALTACGAGIPTLPGVPGLPGAGGSGLSAALDRVQIGTDGPVVSMGYANVQKVRDTFDAFTPGGISKTEQAARDAWSMTLVAAPVAIQMPNPRSPWMGSHPNYYAHATWSVRAHGTIDNNSSYTAGGAPILDELAPKLREAYTIDGDTATLSTQDRILSRSLPATVRKDGDALVTETRGSGNSASLTDVIGDLSSCLGDPDVAVVAAHDRNIDGASAFGTAVSIKSRTDVTAVHCVRAADDADVNRVADALRGHQGVDYTAGEVTIKGKVIKVELTPNAEPLTAASRTVQSMPERRYPTF
ncbi:MAG: hypothetical protein Q4G46_13560 [Propionibacteriaceae bacterium]|nr:hypothetical protein [Propionibacteriaceae bacterium]